MRRLISFRTQVFFVLALLLVSFALTPQLVKALCAQQPEDGTWVNSGERAGISKIQLRFICQDMILNGEPYPPGAPWYTHVFGSCVPTDCDWNEVEAERLGSGHIFAFYDQGYAKRYVYAKMSQYRPGQLWVWIWTDFTDPNRRDYGMHNWFVKQ